MKKEKLKYHLFILGCQMNRSDGERIASILDKMGYSEAQNEAEADLIIVIACSVRQTAIDRIYGKIKLWNQIKNKRPLVTALTGCILPHDKKKMTQTFDIVFDISEIAQLPNLLKSKPGLFGEIVDYFDIHPLPQSKWQIYIPIMTGCNNFCSYCAVPYTRGREKSRPSKKILNEVKKFIKLGYKEIILLGQNVNSYGHDLKNEINFSQLLKQINDLPGDFWLRFLTSHPKDMSEELIKTIAQGEKICEYIHLPIQSGDDEILKKMNRKYTVNHYKKLITMIRKYNPGIAISTDVIVGFPGESKKQFNNTKKIFKAVAYDMAYINKYSPRTGTLSARWEDNISWEEKKLREKELNAVMEKTALAFNKKLINTHQAVLVEGCHKEDKNFVCHGKNRNFITTKFSSEKDLTGKIVAVKIIQATPYGLNAKI